jgi:methylamine dehydrogenase heavy chain
MRARIPRAAEIATCTRFAAAAIGAYAAAALGAGVCSAASSFPNPLAAETGKLGAVETLPAKYPTSWAWLNYTGNRIELRNVGSDSREVKAQLPSRDSAILLVPEKRPELYVADTVWSRGTRGVRTDFITIYDVQTLNPIGEIVLPGAKRALITAMEGMFAFTDDQRLALVFNFTPASSVTIVDLVKRQVLGEVEIPGCSLVYPSGTRGFSTLCSSGTLLSVRLDANGACMAAFSPSICEGTTSKSCRIGRWCRRPTRKAIGGRADGKSWPAMRRSSCTC